MHTDNTQTLLIPDTFSECFGREMDVEKAKVTRITRELSPVQIMVDQKQLVNVEYFNNFGTMISCYAKYT
jgi:hypothetical protein